MPVFAFLWLLFSFLASESLPPQHSRFVVNTAQGDRECVLHAPPAYDQSKPIPLVIMLHGFGGTALSALRETGWSAKADQETFIVAYPEATRPDNSRPPNFRKNPQAWNDGSGRFHAAERKIDDVEFIDALINQIGMKYKLDSQRIFITGFSNGASMTFRLGAELSQPIAAIAPVAGTCWMKEANPRHSFSLCYITGLADTLNPIEGGYPKLALGGKEQGGQAKPAVLTFIDRWGKALNCPGQSHVDETAKGVRKRVYGPGRQGAEIVFITVEGLGHTWAGGVGQAPSILVGKSTDKLHATDTVWDFFRSHPAPREQTNRNK